MDVPKAAPRSAAFELAGLLDSSEIADLIRERRRSGVPTMTRKGGGYYGYKVHAAVDTLTGLPMAWTVETAKAAETTFALGLLVRDRGFAVATRDRGQGLRQRADPRRLQLSRRLPVTPLRQTPAVKRGIIRRAAAGMASGRHAGTDYKRQATEWRCPGDCQPKSTWVKADRLHPLIPRHTERSKVLYSSRGAIEREFGRLKHEWSLLPLRVRGIERVRLHADLTILAKLATTLNRGRAVPVVA